MVLLSDLHYFPSIIFYKTSYKFSNIFFEQYDGYRKMSFLNRCVIAGANGAISLSIPLKQGRNQKAIIRDVKMAGKNWQSQHWKTLESCYNKSPWFEFYKDELQQLYSKEHEFLLDWNLACFEWSIRKLNMAVTFSLTEKFEEKPGDGIADFRNRILPKNYQSFSAIAYRQVFEERIGFLPNLSILDLLFCKGKSAKDLLGTVD